MRLSLINMCYISTFEYFYSEGTIGGHIEILTWQCVKEVLINLSKQQIHPVSPNKFNYESFVPENPGRTSEPARLSDKLT